MRTSDAHDPWAPEAGQGERGIRDGLLVRLRGGWGNKARTQHGPAARGVKRVRVRLVPGQHVSGAFGINDGGYHKWAATQSADKTDTGPSYAEWRKQMESVRKDIECFFGRFKTPLTFHDKGDIDNAFFTCVALQNILLEWNKTQGFVTTWEVDAA